MYFKTFFNRFTSEGLDGVFFHKVPKSGFSVCGIEAGGGINEQQRGASDEGGIIQHGRRDDGKQQKRGEQISEKAFRRNSFFFLQPFGVFEALLVDPNAAARPGHASEKQNRTDALDRLRNFPGIAPAHFAHCDNPIPEK